MIIEELAYKVTVRAEDFLSGKKKVEEGAKELNKNISDSMEESAESVSDVTDEVKKAGKQAKKTADDTKRPFGLISGGFNLAAKKAKEFGKEGKEAFSTVELGAAKYLGLALSIEGTRRLFMSATNNLVAVGNTSSFLDLDPKVLDGWQKGAVSIGSSAEAITGALLKMKNASAQMNGYGGPVDSSTTALLQLNEETHKKFNIFGTQDPSEMTKRFEAAYRTLSKNRQLFYLNNVGIDASLDPSIRDKSLDEKQGQFQGSSEITQDKVKEAREVTAVLVKLNSAIGNVGNDLVLAFGPDLVRILEEFGKWITDHKDDVIGFFKEASKFAKSFSEAVGGTANALKILGGAYAGYKVGGLPGAIAGAMAPVVMDESNGITSSNPAPAYKKGMEQIKKDSESDKVWPWLRKWFPLKSEQNQETGFIPEPEQRGQSVRRKQSHDFGMDALANAVMMVESRGNPNAVNLRSGATGAYQFMPDTARDMGLRVDEQVDERKDPVKSRTAFMKYMNQLLNRYNGNTELALMAYNGGMGRVDNALKGKGNPLAKETMDYPGKVADYYQQLQQMAGMQGVAGMQTQTVDNSQSSATHINNVHINSNPQSIDEIAKSIDEQRRRSAMTGAFISGNG